MYTIYSTHIFFNKARVYTSSLYISADRKYSNTKKNEKREKE